MYLLIIHHSIAPAATVQSLINYSTLTYLRVMLRLCYRCPVPLIDARTDEAFVTVKFDNVPQLSNARRVHRLMSLPLKGFHPVLITVTDRLDSWPWKYCPLMPAVIHPLNVPAATVPVTDKLTQLTNWGNIRLCYRCQLLRHWSMLALILFVTVKFDKVPAE
jgi:hypothetical protein